MNNANGNKLWHWQSINTSKAKRCYIFFCFLIWKIWCTNLNDDCSNLNITGSPLRSAVSCSDGLKKNRELFRVGGLLGHGIPRKWLCSSHTWNWIELPRQWKTGHFETFFVFFPQKPKEESLHGSQWVFSGIIWAMQKWAEKRTTKARLSQGFATTVMTSALWPGDAISFCEGCQHKTAFCWTPLFMIPLPARHHAIEQLTAGLMALREPCGFWNRLRNRDTFFSQCNIARSNWFVNASFVCTKSLPKQQEMVQCRRNRHNKFWHSVYAWTFVVLPNFIEKNRDFCHCIFSGLLQFSCENQSYFRIHLFPFHWGKHFRTKFGVSDPSCRTFCWGKSPQEKEIAASQCLPHRWSLFRRLEKTPHLQK